ncbi:MAG: hypothetical protein GX896_05805, partial [Clostridiales bacterium]|nr:hypothetical protein [Clostridiales bacterium]
VSVPYAVQQQFNYKISINNESLVVPSKYNDLAQRLKVLVKDFDSRYKYNYSDYNPYDPNDMQDEFYEEN